MPKPNITVYISGPMTGVPQFNYPLFDEAARYYRVRGHQVINPADISRRYGILADTPPESIDPSVMRRIMGEEIEALKTTNYIVVLPGWENSKGALAEVSLACWYGASVLRWDITSRHPAYLESIAGEKFNALAKAADEVLAEKAPTLAAEAGVDPKKAIGDSKCPMGLLPLKALEEVAWALGDGAKKYGEWNWRATSVVSSTYLSAMLRHLSLYQAHEEYAKDSGRHHLAHIAASCLILLDADAQGRLVQDHAPVHEHTPVSEA